MYTPCYPGGWKDGKDGQTPINAAALNHMEGGIRTACRLTAGAFLFSVAVSLAAIWNTKK